MCVIVYLYVRGVVRKQSNQEQHDFHFCQDKSANWTKIPECPVPEFQPKPAEVSTGQSGKN